MSLKTPYLLRSLGKYFFLNPRLRSSLGIFFSLLRLFRSLRKIFLWYHVCSGPWEKYLKKSTFKTLMIIYRSLRKKNIFKKSTFVKVLEKNIFLIQFQRLKDTNGLLKNHKKSCESPLEKNQKKKNPVKDLENI